MIDTALLAVCARDRRVLLSALDRESPRTVAALAAELPTEGRDSATVRLHHVHLPRLDDAGFVTWDREEGVVARGPDFEDVRPFLSLFPESE